MYIVHDIMHFVVLVSWE